MKRILVIEDNAAMREEIATMLDFEGYEVMRAEDGCAGVELATSTRPDLILCDVMMPRLDGYGTLKAVRRDPQIATTPFVFLSAKASDDDVRFGRSLGADAYMVKPFTVDTILQTIERLLPREEVRP